MSKTSNKSDMNALAEQFAAITGAAANVGLRLLDVCNGDLDRAISMHLDGVDLDAVESQVQSNYSTSQDAAGPSIPPDDSVRAPIPSKMDTLLDGIPTFELGPRQRTRQSVFDGLRDFKAETELQEEMLYNPKSSSKKRTLEDLFRPPLDLMHKGTFVTAREAGQLQGKWLMVNVQNVREFSCQKLNRDVWSDSTVRSIIRESFIFWQVYHDSGEGQRYMQFYKVREFPYVSILDPRTGEEMAMWHNIDNEAFCEVVMQFLCEHKMDVPDVIPLSPPADSPSSSGPPAKKSRTCSIIDASEESQIEAAIAASLAEAEAANAKPQQGTKRHSGVISIISDSDNDAEDDEDDDVIDDDVVETIESDFAFSDTEPVVERANSVIVKAHPTNGNGPSRTSEVHDPSSDKVDVEDGGKEISVIKRTEAGDKPKSNGQLENVDGSIPINNGDNCSDSKKRQSQKQFEDGCSGGDTADKVNESGKSLPELDVDEEKLSGPVATVMLRFPDGRRKQVCLAAASTLKALTKLVAREGFSREKYELITNFPRRRLSALDSNTSLSDAGLCPQESVFVQER